MLKLVLIKTVKLQFNRAQKIAISSKREKRQTWVLRLKDVPFQGVISKRRCLEGAINKEGR